MRRSIVWRCTPGNPGGAFPLKQQTYLTSMDAYLRATRSPWYSFLFALPLLAAYQVVVVAANFGAANGVINGADAMIRGGLSLVGVHGWLATSLVLAALIGVFAYRSDAAHRKGPVRWRYFPALLLEAAVYAVLFGGVVAFITRHLLPFGGFLQIGGGVTWGQRLASGLGAGLYEELVFRLGLTGGLIWVLQRFRWKPGPAAAAAVLVSSVIFSLFHYVGPYGEPLQLYSFTFRFVAGVVLAALFAIRGFAVAAWTHSLYDVFLLVLGGG